MFGSTAEEALSLYESLFDDFEVTSIDRYGPDVTGRQGTVREARWRLAEQDFIAVDSPAEQPFAFTPCMSLFINCRDDAALERLFAGLSEDGAVLMPLGDRGFSRHFRLGERQVRRVMAAQSRLTGFRARLNPPHRLRQGRRAVGRRRGRCGSHRGRSRSSAIRARRWPIGSRRQGRSRW